MKRQFSIAVGVLAFAGAAFGTITDQTLTIPVNSRINLDNGTIVTTGGDWQFTGTNFVPVGSTVGFGFGPAGQQAYDGLTQAQLQNTALLFTNSPVPVINNQVIACKTNSGNLAKLLFSAVSGTSATFKFTTYGTTGGSGGGGGPTAPTITSVQNNSSV